jgi:transposase
MNTNLLLPGKGQLQIDGIEVVDDQMTIIVSSTERAAVCPDCQMSSERANGHYQRRPADLPCAGYRVCLDWRVRRYFCDNESCPRRTFSERFPAIAQRYARRTNRLARQQQLVVFEVGGQVAARLAQVIRSPASRDTHLRLIRCTPEPSVATPRVLGVDDWAKRKGHSYGTILIDLEAHRVIDLLPERSAAALANWLKEHPGVEIISRDRGVEYVKGATTGAPEAAQVADRWHLLKNLGEALSSFLETNPACLSAAAKEPQTTDAASTEPVPVLHQEMPPAKLVPAEAELATCEQPPASPTKAEARKQARHARKQERYEQVRTLVKEGFSMNEIQKLMHMSYRTVAKYLQAEACPFYPEGVRRGSKLDPYLAYLEEQWDGGQHNATELWRQICQDGFQRSRGLVAQWAAKKRPYLPTASDHNHKKQPAPPPPAKPLVPWSVRRVTWLLFRSKADLDEGEVERLEQVLQVNPTVAKVHDFVHSFQQMVRQKQPEKLPSWLDDVQKSGIEAFVTLATGMAKDFDAVRNALMLSWSNGQTEGQVNRLKFIKRQGYGRANFDLLRKRVLGPPQLA